MRTIFISLLCLLMSACNAQEPKSQKPIPQNPSNAKPQSAVQQYVEDLRAYLGRAAEEDTLARVLLAKNYIMAPAKMRDYEKAVSLLQEAAAKGDASAQYELAWCYYSGKGLVKNRDEAYKIWKESCEKGFAASCQRLKKKGGAPAVGRLKPRPKPADKGA